MAGKVKFNLDKIVEYGIYLWLFILPWQTRYVFKTGLLNGEFWEYGSQVIYVGEILLVVLIILRLFNKWRQGELHLHQLTSVKIFSLPTALFIFVLLAVMSVSWSVYPVLSSYFVLKLILAGGVFWLIIDGQISQTRLVIVLIASGIVQGWLVINQFLNQYVGANKWLGMAEQDAKVPGTSVVETTLDRWLRGYGSLPNPNIAGGFLSIVLVFVIYYYFNFRSFLHSGLSVRKISLIKTGLLGALVFVISGIALTFSRAAWLTAGLIWLVWLFKCLYQRKKSLFKIWFSMFVVSAVIIGMWYVIYPEPFVTRLKGKEVLELRSIYEREQSIRLGWEVLRENLVKGAGVGTYTYALYNREASEPAWYYQPVHNTYLLILSELGLLGALSGLYVLSAIFRNKYEFYIYVLLGSMLFLWLFDHWWWSLNFGWYFTAVLFALIHKQNLPKKQISIR